jgi:Gram-negative bacterial TonB protein C-terminal
MPDIARLPRLLAALSLMIPLLGAAQAPAMSDAERARRDAEKVFGFIKFQTVKPKPAAEPDKPRKPVATSAPRPASPARQTETAAAPQTATPATGAPASPAPSQTVASVSTPPPSQTVASVSTPPPPNAAPSFQPQQPAASFSGAPVNTLPPPPAAVPEPEANEAEEVPLQLQRFVEPVLPRTTRNALENSTRDIIVTVRFTVEANGTVSKAEALTDVPLRFARPATDAVLQWQFAPLPQARTVDVEIAFRRG